MAHQRGRDQHQVFFFSLDDQMGSDHPARVIDAFVESLDFTDPGFQKAEAKRTGSPPLHPGNLLKLYICGYLNKVRSSPGLAHECERNVELWRLFKCLGPKYRTEAAFRANHPKALKNVLRQIVSLLDQLNLLGKEILTLDDSKFLTQNARKNNYNQKKIDRHKACDDDFIKGYFQSREQTAKRADKKEIHAKIVHTQERGSQYEILEDQLADQQTDQKTTVDEDCRAMIVRRQIVEVGYNVQTVVDARHNLVVTCEDQQVTPYVGVLRHSQSKKGVPVVNYRSSDFTYYPAKDAYVCPEGYWLTTTATLTTKGNHDYRMTNNKAGIKSGRSCLDFGRCTTAKNGRTIERSEYQDAIDRNAERVTRNQEVYHRRQAITENPFGTITRGWGYAHKLFKGLPKVNRDMALIFLAYNLIISMFLMSVKGLTEALKSTFLAILTCGALWSQNEGKRITILQKHSYWQAILNYIYKSKQRCFCTLCC